ncbi:60S ribosomal protein L6-like [Agrilus planipennis]|uniref:Large ribosomal subunit protein eL6 n=1 Tax=Agrilus planipennis TaxID=224129 RepID=A0A7F5R046_AGRPL|nr:60S ribosomal protein L6-like [Agrilus planipennis]XP_025830971.1 60S ribosomal protein L6-like [Agrilus planipennis]
MAPTEAKKAAPAQKKPEAKEKNKAKKRSRPRNYNLGNGVYRFSRSRMYHKKALYKFVGKKVKPTKKPSKPLFVEKPIGGEKNGGKRIVFLKKRRNYFPTQEKIRKPKSKQLFKNHTRNLRKSLRPGTILILLAGVHKGKRVVMLKQLRSGLLLITGPYLINGCPLRRIHQRYVIGTKTKIDLKGFKLPKNINDDYFRRERKKRPKKEEGDIFSAKKEVSCCTLIYYKKKVVIYVNIKVSSLFSLYNH